MESEKKISNQKYWTIQWIATIRYEGWKNRGKFSEALFDFLIICISFFVNTNSSFIDIIDFHEPEAVRGY